MEMPSLIKDIVKVDDYTVKFVLTRPEAPFLANIAMPFASIVSEEYADVLEAAGTQEDLNNAADRHRPVQVRGLSEGRRDPLCQERRLLGHRAR